MVFQSRKNSIMSLLYQSLRSASSRIFANCIWGTTNLTMEFNGFRTTPSRNYIYSDIKQKIAIPLCRRCICQIVQELTSLFRITLLSFTRLSLTLARTMDDLDIQTAQLIIQLARDDIYQFDDNAFGGNNQDGDLLSDLEFALAEQEREFMQHWTGYGGTQINQNAGGPSRRTGGSGNAGGGNMGNSAVAGPSRVPNPRPATPINLIDIEDDYDDIYVNPYSAASSSSNGSQSQFER
ncbi:hypothetical protein M378DRAFT_316957 [Amanita muscaria Koide BX008]|uniref:Uncharacterized protein n=1 Tax=Amanita muscaria (strain Koide BX008) TaxID=946122 RepID=A0A0C2WP07_AMAMK|nr:hypothetical protein M378DRAFT_316957 [Amanita muscaria Koide BX008]